MKDQYILLEDIENVGKAGELVSVAAGYARNFLLPKKLALKASKGALRQFEAQKEIIEAKRKEEIKKAQNLAEKIAELEINIQVNVGEDDRLYGSVTSMNIAEEISKKGIVVDHHKILLTTTIRELGSYEVKIKLHPEVTANAKVWVVRS